MKILMVIGRKHDAISREQQAYQTKNDSEGAVPAYK
jgi:hypothetical protein